MNRNAMLDAVRRTSEPWDLLVIGGGATGLGCAVDAASRGYRTLLLEGSDFAKGTSSRSTKLVHGGVRYLRQGNIPLVRHALHERALLLRNAPHLVRSTAFVIPTYRHWDRAVYGTGLKLYDLLAGQSNLDRSRLLSKAETLRRVPTLRTEGLRGSVLYHDGQFDDARLAIDLARTAAEQGGTLLNYTPVVGLILSSGKVAGVRALDVESNESFEILARTVVNATGVFTDAVRRMESPDIAPSIAPSRGVHLVLDRSFLPGNTAMMVPRTDDGRVLFAIPWWGVVIVGTTDTPVHDVVTEPRPMPNEIAFLLDHAGRYLNKQPRIEDVLSAFAGLRPLAVGEPGASGRSEGGGRKTAQLSRDHALHMSSSGLITVTGGKWTTYRRMAEETIDFAASRAGLEPRPCITKTLPLHGHCSPSETRDDLSEYGADAEALRSLIRDNPGYDTQLHHQLNVCVGQVVWAARFEMARTVEDVLARRTRCLIRNARASLEMAPRVAAILAEELSRDAAWQAEQVRAYADLAFDSLPLKSQDFSTIIG